ncbi:glucosamine-6-phosphate deaminase [Nakamurella panacisegetis]|uniref:Glucosamine-6-phosphate deaminase n=1 Tax=Nakamurella panacisegetis TaxID=1090615 RepID=A0A1H0QT06_9ACTN|nr:6-phosphogluconolactonase [Nakamurella panacisegetis]SDP19849.1 glucosamine-6-phosphate deaminase [Nakamurella panacisegetis]
MNEPALRVLRFPDAAALGRCAAFDVAAHLRDVVAAKGAARVVFAAAPSQSTMLSALLELDVPWDAVTAFHMDEYVGLPVDAPAGFGNWLTLNLFSPARPGRVELLAPGEHPAAAAARYADLLAQAPIDAVVLGIGVNGHLAFNDPPVADPDDPLDVKVVELDLACRQQQVDDGCFDTLDAVPRTAVTLTLPRLLRADRLFCVVPGAHKSTAVRRALSEPVGAPCPATVLRTHPDCTLYLDEASASQLPPERVPDR